MAGKTTVGVLVNLEPYVIAELDKKCGGKGGGKGQHQGRAWYIRRLLHTDLGLPEPEIGAEPKDEIDLRHVDEKDLDRKSCIIVRLYKRGMNFQNIVKFLEQEKIPAPRGGLWRKGSIKRILERVSRRAAAKQAQKVGTRSTRKTTPPKKPRTASTAKG